MCTGLWWQPKRTFPVQDRPAVPLPVRGSVPKTSLSTRGRGTHAGRGTSREVLEEGGRGGGQKLCTQNGPIRFSQRQVSFTPTMVTLVLGRRGSSPPPPILLWCTAIVILPGGRHVVVQHGDRTWCPLLVQSNDGKTARLHRGSTSTTDGQRGLCTGLRGEMGNGVLQMH